MASLPLDGTHGQKHRAWHNIAAFREHTQSDDVGRGMPSSPLGSTHCQTTKSVACHHRPWTRYTVGLRQAWHAIMDLNQHTRSAEVEHSTTSSPLDNTRDRTMSYVACLHGSWNAHMVRGCWAWHAIIALRQHMQSDHVGRDMSSSP